MERRPSSEVSLRAVEQTESKKQMPFLAEMATSISSVSVPSCGANESLEKSSRKHAYIILTPLNPTFV